MWEVRISTGYRDKETNKIYDEHKWQIANRDSIEFSEKLNHADRFIETFNYDSAFELFNLDEYTTGFSYKNNFLKLQQYLKFFPTGRVCNLINATN